MAIEIFSLTTSQVLDKPVYSLREKPFNTCKDGLLPGPIDHYAGPFRKVILLTIHLSIS